MRVFFLGRPRHAWFELGLAIRRFLAKSRQTRSRQLLSEPASNVQCFAHRKGLLDMISNACFFFGKAPACMVRARTCNSSISRKIKANSVSTTFVRASIQR